MSVDAPEANSHDSRALASSSLVLLVRGLLTLAGVAGVVLLVISTFTTVIEIKVLTTSDIAAKIDTQISGADRHGGALIIAAVFAAVMLVGAVTRAARPAMVGLAAAGALALAIAIVSDAAHIHDTGQVGELYEEATADAGPGFFYETLGGALLLVSGGGLLLLAGAGPSSLDGLSLPRRRRAPRERPQQDEEPPAESEPEPRKADDWFSA